jgi:hypothetical protein
MRRIWTCGFLLLALPMLTPSARAGDKTDEPTVVIRVKSLDTVLQNLKLLATLLGREQAAQDIQALIKAKVGAQGLQGVDLDRPVGAYVRFGKELEDLAGALLIPVADQAAFLTLLENFGLNPSKGKDGIYTLQTKQNIDLYLRFAKKYAYVSGINTENLSDKNLLDPAKVLAGADDSVISATVRLDQVPDAAKLLVMASLEQSLQAEEDKAPPGESAVQKQLRTAITRQFSRTVSDTLKDGQRVQVDISLAKDKKDLALRLSLTGRAGTELAKTIADAGKSKSPFAGLMTQNAAFRGSIDAHLPPAIHKAFVQAIQDAAQKGLGDISSEAKRKEAQKLFDALMPTVKSGQLDAFFGMSGPVNNHYTLLAAIKVENGAELGAVVHDLLASERKSLSPAEQQKIQLDVDSVGAVKIHKLELPRDVKTGKFLDDLPGDSNLYVAFRKDAILLALGQKSLGTLKEAIAADQPGTVPLLQFDFNVARMASSLAQTAEQKALAAKLFTAGKDGKIQVTVDGGDALTVRLHVALDVLEFFAKMKGKE